MSTHPAVVLMKQYREIERLEVQLNAAKTALESASIRFGFIKNHHPCIGLTLAHVDGNCVHCSAAFFEKSTSEVISRLEEE